MLAALDAMEALAPACRELAWGADFEASRQEIHSRAVRVCGPQLIEQASLPLGSAEKLMAAEEKMERYAEKEEYKLSSKSRAPSEVTGLTDGELDAASKLVSDGEVTGPAELEAAQEVIDAQNLGDVSPTAVKGGTHLDSETVADVVTVEDIRSVTAEALGHEPDSIALQENPPVLTEKGTRVIIQGDMRVSREHAALLQQGKGARGDTPKVAAGETWPGGHVPYCFAPDLSAAAKRAFLEAVQHYRNTQVSQCITFAEIPVHSSGSRCESHRSLFVQSREAGSCWSDVGFVAGGNEVMLGSGCEFKGIVVHEIGHTLGMDHEQSRPDRDEFVIIQYDNIRDGFADQFEINPLAYTGQPYDYLSVMHYGAFTFSRDRSSLPTITTVQGKASAALGQSMGLSQGDVQQLGDMYCPTMVWVQGMTDSIAATHQDVLNKINSIAGYSGALSLQTRSYLLVVVILAYTMH